MSTLYKVWSRGHPFRSSKLQVHGLYSEWNIPGSLGAAQAIDKLREDYYQRGIHAFVTAAEVPAQSVALVSCAKTKRSGTHPAGELYASELFYRAWLHANRTCAQAFILSAKYGLLEPGQPVESYDLTLRDLPLAERREWAERVLRQIRETIPETAEVYFFCGERYRELLIGRLGSRKIHVPLQGQSIGKQLQWYRKNS